MKPFRLDDMDHEFLMSVESILKDFFDEEEIPSILKNSILMTQLKNDPEFVYHFDENYWAEQIRMEFEAKLRRTKLQ